VLWGHARHTHLRVGSGRGRSWAVRSAGRSRVVLAPAPAESDTRVADGVSLHLVDGHLGGVALDELDEAAALSRGDLDIGDFTKALEEGAKLVLSDVARKTTNENSGVVGVGELVHGLRSSAIVAHGRALDAVHAHGAAGHTTHGTGSHASVLVLGSGSRNAHGAVAAVDTLHLSQGALLVSLVRKSDETVAARKATDGVGHDLGRLARGETTLENADENVFVDLRAEVADEDGELGSAVVTAAIGKTAARCPVELERAVGVGNQGAVQGKSLLGCVRALKVDEAVSSITGEFVSDHLHVDLVSHAEPDASNKVLVDPWLELTHPEGCLCVAAGLSGRGSARGTGSGDLELALLAVHGLTKRSLLRLSASGTGGACLVGGLLTLE